MEEDLHRRGVNVAEGGHQLGGERRRARCRYLDGFLCQTGSLLCCTPESLRGLKKASGATSTASSKTADYLRLPTAAVVALYIQLRVRALWWHWAQACTAVALLGSPKLSKRGTGGIGASDRHRSRSGRTAPRAEGGVVLWSGWRDARSHCRECRPLPRGVSFDPLFSVCFAILGLRWVLGIRVLPQVAVVECFRVGCRAASSRTDRHQHRVVGGGIHGLVILSGLKRTDAALL